MMTVDLLRVFAAAAVSALVAFFAYRSGFKRGREAERWRWRQ